MNEGHTNTQGSDGTKVRARRRRMLTAVVFALLIALAVGMWLRSRETTLTQEGFSMNTVIRISLAGSSGSLKTALDDSFALIARLNHELSLYDSSSTLSAINANAGGTGFIPVSDDTREVIVKARDLCALTEGVFNPLIGPVTRLWKINQGNANPVPTQASLDIVLPLCEIANLEISPNGVRLSRGGAALDLGGIAKGYASHVVAERLRAAQATSAVIDLGGNIYVIGNRALNIGVRNPLDPTSSPIVVITASNSAVITSGGYERFRVIDGVKYSHFFDTRTGHPVRNDMLSATLVTPDGAAADALATTFMILGSERSMQFLHDHSDLGLGAILIRDRNHATDDLKNDNPPAPEVLVTENLRGRVSPFKSAQSGASSAQLIRFF